MTATTTTAMFVILVEHLAHDEKSDKLTVFSYYRSVSFSVSFSLLLFVSVAALLAIYAITFVVVYQGSSVVSLVSIDQNMFNV